MIPEDPNKLAGQIHHDNVVVGWWDEYLPDRKAARSDRAMMLVISELVEGMEGYRKNLPDDHLPDFPMLHVEMADAAIRLLDLAGAYYISVGSYEAYMPRFLSLMTDRAEVPEQLYAITRFIAGVPADGFTVPRPIEHGLYAIFAFCQIHKIDLAHLITLKRAYNAQRADHKRENRAKVGGKAF